MGKGKDVPENPLSLCLTAILSEDKCPLAQFSTKTSQRHLLSTTCLLVWLFQ
jgi:hypothetical protein